jgi:tetratricopeptide (TPR) repeat protein
LIESQHSYRQARRCYLAALSLVPNSPHTLLCLGVAAHLQASYDEAVEYYHAALGIRRDDKFAGDMLNIAIQRCWCAFFGFDLTLFSSNNTIFYVFSEQTSAALQRQPLPPLNDAESSDDEQNNLSAFVNNNDDDDDDDNDNDDNDMIDDNNDSAMNVTGDSSMNLTDTSMNITN